MDIHEGSNQGEQVVKLSLSVLIRFAGIIVTITLAWGSISAKVSSLKDELMEVRREQMNAMDKLTEVNVRLGRVEGKLERVERDLR